MNSFETFLHLHQQQNPLLLGNVWDVNSARIFERRGFKAIATSSAAIAHSLGYEDGEKMPFDVLFGLVKRIASQTSLPFSVDIEGGYSRNKTTIIQHIEMLHQTGVAGINIEDSIMTEKRTLQPVADFQKLISSIADHLRQKNINMFLNVRTDTFLMGVPSPLPETIKRSKAFEEVGAHGIFVPCITAKDDIAEVVKATRLPINVLSMPALPAFEELSALGVKRISMGNAIHDAMTAALEKSIQTIQTDQSFRSLFS